MTHIVFPAWAGGRYGSLGEDIGDERFKKLAASALASGIKNFISADAFGNGAASEALGAVLKGQHRASLRIMSMIGKDFYSGKRGHAGIPFFTDPSLRQESGYVDYVRMSVEKELQRLNSSYLDVLFLQHPDRSGFCSEALWTALETVKREGLCRELGIAPGPQPGYILDLLHVCDTFGNNIQWALLPYGPFDAWPTRHFIQAAQKKNIHLLAYNFDHHGLFYGDLSSEQQLARGDSRRNLFSGWMKLGLDKLQTLRTLPELAGVTPIQAAALWTIEQPSISGVVPSLVQETGNTARPVEERLSELVGIQSMPRLTDHQLQAIQSLGRNDGAHLLKGGSSQYQGPVQVTQWPLTDELKAAAERWGIIPDRDLFCSTDHRDLREKGMPVRGVPTTTDRRLYFQLQVFTGATDTRLLIDALKKSALEAVLYSNSQDAQGVGLVTLSEDPACFVNENRALLSSPPFSALTQRHEFSMFGRTYSLGHEAELEHWLLRRPRQNVFNPNWPWAVWYPLRRSGSFYRLTKQEQTAVLMEHGVIGRNFGEAGYASDIRLECFGLDTYDNEFVIGVTGPRLDWLSKLIQTMRPTLQTSTYMDKLGPFFVGYAIHRNQPSAARA